MKYQEWNRMLRAGESLKVEFKRQLPKRYRLARSFSAFANSAGGTFFFGVEDDGTPVGLESVAGTREQVEQVAAFYCEPQVELKSYEWEIVRGVKLLVVEVSEAELKPVYASNPQDPKDAWPFFRSNRENLALDKKSLKTMAHGPSDPVQDEIDDLDRHTLAILKKLNSSPRQTINELAKCANISAHRAKKIMVQLERRGWVHCFFNEKRREYSLAIPWTKP